MLDYFPFKGSFRLSAGTTVSKQHRRDRLDNHSRRQHNQNRQYHYTSETGNPITPNVSAKFAAMPFPASPSAGATSFLRATKRFSFDTELGIEITGTPKVGWTYGGMGFAGGSETAGPVAASDITVQNASLQSDFNAIKSSRSSPSAWASSSSSSQPASRTSDPASGCG